MSGISCRTLAWSQCWPWPGGPIDSTARGRADILLKLQRRAVGVARDRFVTFDPATGSLGIRMSTPCLPSAGHGVGSSLVLVTGAYNNPYHLACIGRAAEAVD
jgi:hypothetical protein